MLAKSFARIHEANLINAGIMPLTFKNMEDYDELSQGDELFIDNIFEGMESGEITVKNLENSKKIKAACNFSGRQRHILKAGGLLSYVATEAE